MMKTWGFGWWKWYLNWVGKARSNWKEEFTFANTEKDHVKPQGRIPEDKHWFQDDIWFSNYKCWAIWTIYTKILSSNLNLSQFLGGIFFIFIICHVLGQILIIWQKIFPHRFDNRLKKVIKKVNSKKILRPVQ